MTLGAASAIAGIDDTIVAEATAHGRGALAVIRVSGSRCHAICESMTDSWPSAPRLATLSAIRDRDGSLLDTGIVVRYDKPASFTGADSVEFQVQGGGDVCPAHVRCFLRSAA